MKCRKTLSSLISNRVPISNLGDRIKANTGDLRAWVRKLVKQAYMRITDHNWQEHLVKIQNILSSFKKRRGKTCHMEGLRANIAVRSINENQSKL